MGLAKRGKLLLSRQDLTTIVKHLLDVDLVLSPYLCNPCRADLIAHAKSGDEPASTAAISIF